MRLFKVGLGRGELDFFVRMCLFVEICFRKLFGVYGFLFFGNFFRKSLLGNFVFVFLWGFLSFCVVGGETFMGVVWFVSFSGG